MISDFFPAAATAMFFDRNWSLGFDRLDPNW